MVHAQKTPITNALFPTVEIEGVSVPDSALCRAVTEFVRDTETELLFNHSSRVYFFGALAGQKRGLSVGNCSTPQRCSMTSA